ncbi:MAG: ribosomal protein L7/L12 [Hyphomonas sp.]|uniref:ribosomal protein L7/L12 n=1 Tax=Hyphomonas sp. TaxID=87 RepID=UPI0035290A60
MEDYLDKILHPEVLWTVFGAFVLGQIMSGGRRRSGGNSLSPTPPSPEEVKAALKKVTLSKWMEIDAELDARKKIRAIKLLREATGLGLKDSKEAVEARLRNRGM